MRIGESSINPLLAGSNQVIIKLRQEAASVNLKINISVHALLDYKTKHNE